MSELPTGKAGMELENYGCDFSGAWTTFLPDRNTEEVRNRRNINLYFGKTICHKSTI